jgi:hypothetical protein
VASQPTFTAPIRGVEGPHATQRWEHVLSHEASLSYRLTDLLGRLLGIAGVPPPARPGASLSERETRLASMRQAGAYRALEAVRAAARRRRRGREGAEIAAAGEAPSLGPFTAAAVDDAFALMRSLPFDELQRRGWHVQPNHFYWPLNDVEFLAENRALWHERGAPRGIDWDLDGQIELVRRFAPVLRELDDVPDELPADAPEFAWGNSSFSGADAIAYYGVIRTLQPRRVVEVGSGWSSLVLKRALARNDGDCAVTMVEPFPNEEVWAGVPAEWTLHRRLLQHADLELFDALEPGDVCFYDGSHCVRTGSDVNWLVFEVLPRLARGVWVHFHDLFWPDDYADDWIFQEGLSWNEQYLVQAFLMHNDSYRVRLANRLLFRERRQELAAAYPRGALDGGSVWLEKIG